MRTPARTHNTKRAQETERALRAAVQSLRSADELHTFLYMLLSAAERQAVGQRILIARALLGGMTYDDVVHRWRVGRDTVAKVHHALKAHIPEYKSVVRTLKNEHRTHRAARDEQPLHPASVRTLLRRRHATHFLLFPDDERA